MAAIQRCQRGEIAGLEPLVRRYHAQAARVAYLLTGDAALAEDIAQEAFLRAFAAIRRFRIDEPFLPWFLRIVTNLARQTRRTVARRREASLPQGELLGAVSDGGVSDDDADSFRLEVSPLARAWAPDPVVAAERTETHAAFVVALARLSAKQREAVVLRYYLGYSDQELARIVGCRPGAARQRLSDGLRALERIIRRDYAWLIDQEPGATATLHAQPTTTADETERRLAHGTA